MVVRLLGDGIHVLGAVRDHTAIIRQTLLDRGVVGDGVVIAVLCGLTGDQTQGYHGYQQYSAHFGQNNQVLYIFILLEPR